MFDGSSGCQVPSIHFYKLKFVARRCIVIPLPLIYLGYRKLEENLKDNVQMGKPSGGERGGEVRKARLNPALLVIFRVNQILIG